VIGPLERVLSMANRATRHDGTPFDPGTAFAAPSGAHWNWCHYGVMVPGLPDPHRTFGAMAIVGTPGVSIFANDWAITTTPRDTAYLVSATGSMTRDRFRTYSIADACTVEPGTVRFGDDLTIEGEYPRFAVHRDNGETTVDLAIVATDTVTWFVDLPGVYEHWSLLGDYTGQIVHDDVVTPIGGQCTLEYARGTGPNAMPRRLAARATIPARTFTYQVLNLDASRQLLLTEVLGPLRTPILRTVYLRSPAGSTTLGATRFAVSVRAPVPLATPDGRRMRMAQAYSWEVRDRAHRPLITLDCVANDDWVYGLGAGFVGSFRYLGVVSGDAVEGTGYIEYVDLG
jgi:hypothetical protein